MPKYKYPPITGLLTRCVTCNTIKDDAYFKQQYGRRVGLVCRDCSNDAKLVKHATDEEKQRRSEKSKNYYSNNRKAIREQSKIYREENSEAIKKAKQKYHIENADKINARTLKWYKENKEYVSEKSKIKYIVNREKVCAAGRERYKNNKEAYKENYKLWRLNNPRANTAYVRQYNLAKINRTPSWADVKAINTFYRNCPSGLQIDHIHPLQGKFISGFHVLENLQYLTKEENTTKSNRFYPYWVTYEPNRIRVETSGPEASIFSIVRRR